MMETIATQLATMSERISAGERALHERLNDLRAWLFMLTLLYGLQLAALVVLAIAVLR